MRSPDRPRLAADERNELSAIACGAVVAAVRGERFSWPPAEAGALAAPGASFVTLHRNDGALRGCIGSIEARRPLATDVAANARAAALEDSRFEPVDVGELAELMLEVSVLSPLTPLAAASRAELLAALRRGVDGLLLEAGARRATFLPSVWEQLPEAERFLAQLERKAGLPVGGWPRGLRVFRYTTEALPAVAVPA